MEKVRQLFLDCDGVLADFNKKATEICGGPPREFEDKVGEQAFWDKLYDTPEFFYSLDPMPDAYELVDAVKHLKPIILTGRPRGEWSVDQKLRWRDKYFPDLEMIVCRSRDKIKHAQPGDVIVDDWEKWRPLWVNGGGVWVLHTSAQNSIRELKKIGLL
jgi:5'(3')-deoxyribonucleotidase